MSGYEINYSQETFRLYLKNIGISYRHLKKTLRIMEIPHLKKMRAEYVCRIKKYREERNIKYYSLQW
jgi:hypothetical protein